ncbi:glycosyltransferase [Prochlorococcus marinus]|nr:glycosyltransferase [Prochlorococcus marinus]
MKVLHISYSYDFKDGGITTVVEQLIREQKKTKIKVEWLASNLFLSPFKRKKLIKEILKINPTIVHLHGLWRVHTRITNDLLKADIPYVITPHGMLDKWALNQSQLKKIISWYLWEKKALNNSSFIQVLSSGEFEAIKKINSAWKCHLISNGIFMPQKKELKLNEYPKSWEDKIPRNSNVLLFLGRFHKKKGINELIKAWEIVSKYSYSKNWWICFAGSGNLKILKKFDNKSLIKRIIVSKPVFDLEKEKVFRNSSAFILSSFSEGLPMAALEAMSYGIPCLISENCNLSETLNIGAAIKTNPSVNEIIKSLKYLIKMDDNEKKKISKLAYNYVSINHNWSNLTSQLNDLYRSVCEDIL